MGDRRDQRRWQRELEAQLRALPTYEGDTPDGGNVTPLARDLPRVPRQRRTRPERRRTAGMPRERRRTVITLLITFGVIGVVFSASLSPWVDQLRGVLGFGDRGDGSAYEFIVPPDPLSGKPLTWSSCEPIPYVVNPAQAPRGWEDTLDAALAEVSEASGLEFADEGTTDDGPDVPRFARGNRPLPVLISWVTPEQVPELADTVVGVAGPQTAGGDVYVTGTVFLDAPAFADMRANGEESLEQAVIMHELGHLVGLGHVDDERQLMYESTTFQTSFGNGDLEGLRLLGEGPCR